MRSPELLIRARYVFPVDGPPVAGGAVAVTGPRIDRVGRPERRPDIDLGNAAIVPGLVNAHTHLELSSLRAKGLAGGGFPDWLRRVVEARRGQAAADLARAIERGIDACLSAGTTLVGDISTGGASRALLARSPLRATVFCELIGLSAQRVAETAEAARRWLAGASAARGRPPVRGTLPGDATRLMLPDGRPLEPLPAPADSLPGRSLGASLSPHAPYSTHPLLYDLAADWGRRSGLPLSTHLAETPEELELIRSRSGPLRDFLTSIGAWDDAWRPAGATPADYLDRDPARHADWLIAHGNYLTDGEIAALGRRGATDGPRRAVAYCPRTHAYFGHPRHPYPKMLAAGVTVCLGTDSLASTPTLSVLDEMRFVFRRGEGLPGEALLRMGTLAGAWSLGRDDCLGTLTPGKLADLAVVRLPDRDEADPHRLLFDSDQPVSHTMIGGRFVFQLR